VGVYGVPQVYTGLMFDSRDDETIPSRGGQHEVKARLSPGSLVATPFTYGGVLINLRQYQAIAGDYLVFAGRALAELIFGDAPFYELGQWDSGNLLGGVVLRGVPLLRYYGKIKLVANFELRSLFVRFTVLKQRFRFGAVVFFDCGRVWADFRPNPTLDGTGFGLKYGVGGGLRLLWGSTFMLRADLAWSPDATPIGFYFNAGHLF
jgi:hypothetical protein